jgi:hypothetical protein
MRVGIKNLLLYQRTKVINKNKELSTFLEVLGQFLRKIRQIITYFAT